MRRGITLLEVLISVFVMLVGLLGVMSLIPVGKFEQTRGTKADRSAACGRAALREIKTRGILNPDNWALANGIAVFNRSRLTLPFTFDNGTNWVKLQPVVIDPLGIISATDNGYRSFPYDSAASAVPTAPHLPRLTLGVNSVIDPSNSMSPADRLTLRRNVSDVAFRSDDELVFEQASGDVLPQQGMIGGAKRSSEGNCSWLATLIPDPLTATDAGWREMPCRLSIVVFFKRDLGTVGLNERMIEIKNVLGEGEAELESTVSKEQIDTKKSQWLMIAGTPNETTGPWHYSWQRIVGRDDISGTGTVADPWKTSVSLVGDRQEFFVGPSAKNYAFLFDGIQTVFQTDINLESP